MNGQLADLARGQLAEPADITIVTDRTTFGRLVNRELTVESATKKRLLSLSGNTDTARRLLDAAVRTS